MAAGGFNADTEADGNASASDLITNTSSWQHDLLFMPQYEQPSLLS